MKTSSLPAAKAQGPMTNDTSLRPCSCGSDEWTKPFIERGDRSWRQSLRSWRRPVKRRCAPLQAVLTLSHRSAWALATYCLAMFSSALALTLERVLVWAHKRFSLCECQHQDGKMFRWAGDHANGIRFKNGVTCCNYSLSGQQYHGSRSNFGPDVAPKAAPKAQRSSSPNHFPTHIHFEPLCREVAI